MKKTLSLVLALLLALSGLQALALAEEGQYPTEWDLTRLFADADAWEASYAECMDLVGEFALLRGTLDTPEGYLAFFDLDDQLTMILNPLSAYAYFRYSLNPGDPEAMDMLGRIDMLYVTLMQSLAFFDEEVDALSMERREDIFADERLALYAYTLSGYLEEDFDPLPEEVVTALSYLSPATSQFTTIYNAFSTLELPKIAVTLSDGTEMEIGEQEYMQFVYSDADREDKALMNDAFVKQYEPYKNTFAAILQGYVSTAWGSAQISDYDSVLEMQLDVDDIDPAVYDMLITAAYDNAHLYTRYLTIMKEGLGLDVMYPFDTAQYLSDFEPESLSYDVMVDEVREVLSVLGDEYIAAYDAMVTGGFIDVYPTETKLSGAYSFGVGGVTPSFIMLNNYGVPGETSTLAHEMGHALYEYFTQQNQPTAYWYISIFTHEVASTTNELLYYLYKMDNAQSDDERLYYLEECLATFGGTFFIQALYSEFEDRMYKTVEAGGVLDAQVLSDTWASLYSHYRGDAIATFDGFQSQWAGIPHFLGTSYYVYQYATSICYAAAIVSAIREGDEAAVESYLDFLKAGASDAPVTLLQNAGVDPLDQATYDRAIAFVTELIDEYEALGLQ